MPAKSWAFRFLTFRHSLRQLVVFACALWLSVGIAVVQEIASNEAGRAVLNAKLDALPYDYLVSEQSTMPDQITAVLSGTAHVKTVSYALFVDYFGAYARTNSSRERAFVLATAANFPGVSSQLGWRGDFVVQRGEVVLSARVAAGLQVGVGDPVEVGRDFCDPTNGSCEFRGLQYNVSAVVREEKGGSRYLSPFMAFLTLGDGEALYDLITRPLNPTPAGSFPFEFLTWVDRETFLSALDPAGNIQRAAQVQGDLELATGFATVESPLRSALSTYASDLAPLQGLFLALAVPAVGVAFSLCLITWEKAAHESLESMRLFRIRGMSERAALSGLFLPGIVASAIAVILALLFLPTLLEVLWQLATASGATDTPASSPGSWGLSYLTTTWSLVFLIALFAFQARAVRADLSRPPGKHRVTAQESRHKGLFVDYSMLALGFGLAVYITAFDVITDAVPALETLVGGILGALTPLAGALLVGGVVRPLLRIRGVRERLSALWAHASGVLGKRFLRERLSRQKPRSTVPLVLAISVAFIFTGFASLASEQAYREKVATALVGGDLFVESNGGRNLLGNLTGLRGVRYASEVQIFPAIGTSAGDLVLFNASSYHSVVGNDPYFFSSVGGNVSPFLVGSTAVVVNEVTAKENGLRVGDRLVIRFRSVRFITPTVTAIVRVLPGLQPPGSESFDAPVVYGDMNTLLRFFPEANESDVGIWRFLLKTDPGTDVDQLVDTILSSFPAIREVRVAQGMSTARLGAAGLLGPFFAFETALTLTLVLFSIVMTSTSLFAERRTEIVTLRVRGAGRRAVAGLLWGETASVGSIGLIAGLAMGLLWSWLFVDSLSKMVDPSELNRPYVVGAAAALSVVIFAGAFLVASAVIAWKVANPRMAANLKERPT